MIKHFTNWVLLQVCVAQLWLVVGIVGCPTGASGRHCCKCQTGMVGIAANAQQGLVVGVVGCPTGASFKNCWMHNRG